MKLQQTLLAAMLAVASASAGATTTALTFTSGTAHYGADVVGTFLDKWTFSVPESTKGVGVGTVTSSIKFDFSTFALTYPVIGTFGIFNEATNTNVSTALLDLGGIHSGTNLFTWAQTLGAGTYSLRIGGTSLEPGSYGGTFSLATAPVPEAETYTMMLVGLGLIGFIASRRRVE
jgi:hypothetical protein